LRDADVIIDAQARAIVPDCAAVPDGIYRRNCDRARHGWSGDQVALARAYRYPGGIEINNALAARLFKLAADRGNALAQTELALMLRRGEGVARDLPRAITLWQTAASAGEPAAMNMLGLMARDGAGDKHDDAEAVAWFRKAADLRNAYAFANLGRMYWEGRGGLPPDKTEAVKFFRASAFLENPWGRLYLAEALEKGEGAERDGAQALDLYRAVAAQDRDPEARRRAQEALNR
jgi:TPR repeat protein